MDSGTATTLTSVATSVVVAVLTLIYWELRSRTAKARQDALAAEVKAVPAKTVDALSQPESTSAASTTPTGSST